jgi:hypothetical protein
MDDAVDSTMAEWETEEEGEEQQEQEVQQDAANEAAASEAAANEAANVQYMADQAAEHAPPPTPPATPGCEVPERSDEATEALRIATATNIMELVRLQPDRFVVADFFKPNSGFRSAYRRACMRAHPDRDPSAQAVALYQMLQDTNDFYQEYVVDAAPLPTDHKTRRFATSVKRRVQRILRLASAQ